MIYWLLFVLFSSITEAHLFHHYREVVKGKVDEHIWFTAVRMTVCVGCYSEGPFIPFLLVCGLTFPFLHDGIYYWYRNYLNPNIYPLKWRDRSTTTDAVFSFGFRDRVILFIAGVAIYTLNDLTLLR
jgi:hypothetical protein